MVSHKHKCIFVHVPKAAGTSIERAFMEDLNIDMDNRHALLLGKNTNKHIGPRRISHLTAAEYVDLNFVSQENFNNYYKFAIVRNPVDRLYSTYKYRGFIDYLSFDDYIKFKLEDYINSETEGYFYKSQYDYIYKNGKQLVDFVGKLENLDLDFENVNQNLNGSFNLKHYNESVRRGGGLVRKIKVYRKIIKDPESWNKFSLKNNSKALSEKSLLLIEKYYGKDFEEFNYPIPEPEIYK